MNYVLVTDQLLEKLRRLVGNLYVIKGKPNGLATLDDTGNVPSSQLANAGGGSGLVSSVFSRTGAITAQTGDYLFNQIGSTPTTLAGYGITDGVSLTGSQTLTNKTLTAPSINALSNLTSNGFVKTGSGNGTLSVDTNTYLTANQSITLSGDISGTGTTAITTAIGANKVTLGMHATLAATSVIGNNTGSTATPTAITVPMIVASGTVSNAATLDINMSAYYNLFKTIEVRLISFLPATNAVDIACRVSTDGTTFDASSGNYKWAFNFISDSTGAGSGLDVVGSSTSDTGITMNGTGTHIGNGATASYNATIKLYNPGVSTFRPQISFNCSYYNQTSSDDVCLVTGVGTRIANQVTKGLRFLFSSGNIASGIYRVIGYP